jgi:hypothetical protein
MTLLAIMTGCAAVCVLLKILEHVWFAVKR